MHGIKALSLGLPRAWPYVQLVSAFGRDPARLSVPDKNINRVRIVINCQSCQGWVDVGRLEGRLERDVSMSDRRCECVDSVGIVVFHETYEHVRRTSDKSHSRPDPRVQPVVGL